MREPKFPAEPVIREGESTESVQMRMECYYRALRKYWQANGIDVKSTATESQCNRLAAILRLHGSRGLGSLEGRAAGAFVQLPTRVSDLKDDGFDIASIPENKHGGDGLFHVRTARYVLISEPKQETV